MSRKEILSNLVECMMDALKAYSRYSVPIGNLKKLADSMGFNGELLESLVYNFPRNIKEECKFRVFRVFRVKSHCPEGYLCTHPKSKEPYNYCVPTADCIADIYIQKFAPERKGVITKKVKFRMNEVMNILEKEGTMRDIQLLYEDLRVSEVTINRDLQKQIYRAFPNRDKLKLENLIKQLRCQEVITVFLKFTESFKYWSGSILELQKELEKVFKVCYQDSMNADDFWSYKLSQSWMRDPRALGHKIVDVKSFLEKYGIDIVVEKTKTSKSEVYKSKTVTICVSDSTLF